MLWLFISIKGTSQRDFPVSAKRHFFLRWSKKLKEASDQGSAEALGAYLREARRARGKTQAFLARKAGISRETIVRLEKGRGAHPSTLLQIVRVLGLKTSDLPLDRASRGRMRNVVGSGLRMRRKVQGLSLATCAAAAGVSISALSRLETGIHQIRGLYGMSSGPHDYWLANGAYAAALGFDTPAALKVFCREQAALYVVADDDNDDWGLDDDGGDADLDNFE